MSPVGLHRNRRFWIGLALLAIVTVGTIELRPDGKGPPVPGIPPERLSGEAAEMLSFAPRRELVPFHARYRLTGDDSQATVLEDAWLDGGRQRVSREAQAPDGSMTRTETIVVPDQAVGCAQSPGEDWACSPIPNRSTSDLRLFEEPTATELLSVTVEPHDDKVGDEAVRCFSLARSGETTEVCFTSDGIPARFVAGTTRRELVELNRGPVEASTFDLPAPLS